MSQRTEEEWTIMVGRIGIAALCVGFLLGYAAATIVAMIYA